MCVSFCVCALKLVKHRTFLWSARFWHLVSHMDCAVIKFIRHTYRLNVGRIDKNTPTVAARVSIREAGRQAVQTERLLRHTRSRRCAPRGGGGYAMRWHIYLYKSGREKVHTAPRVVLDTDARTRHDYRSAGRRKRLKGRFLRTTKIQRRKKNVALLWGMGNIVFISMRREVIARVVNDDR
jgi:hypothetical protein